MSVRFSERELDIMAVLWERGPSTAAEIRAALDDDITHNTVLKMLSILEEKGHVEHVEEGRAHRFHALVAREAAGSSAFTRLVDKMFSGSAEALLTHFVQERRLTREELERVRRILDERIKAEPPTMRARDGTRRKGGRS